MTANDFADYQRAFPGSSALAERAVGVLAGGVTHEVRRFPPFPVAVERANGPWKSTVEGRRLVDLWMGHGAVLFGHGHPEIVEAVRRQAGIVTHPGAAHEAEVAWAERVCALVPSAERVRFTSSGTEAVQLALRVARAVTGRRTVVLFDGHFHGWADETLAPFVDRDAAGIAPGATAGTAVVSPLDVGEAVERAGADDVAAVLLEPGGGGGGALPRDIDLLRELRSATATSGAVLVFDETVTGFRAAPGGVQAAVDIVPDLTVLGKVLCGGLPGGAIAGRADVMSVFWLGAFAHAGTFNANPLSAVAGLASVDLATDGTAQAAAASAAEELAAGIRGAAARAGVDASAYTDGSSIVHFQLGPLAGGALAGPSAATFTLYRSNPEAYAALRRALLVEGVDTHPLHAWISSVHDQAVEQTIDAFTSALRRIGPVLDSVPRAASRR